MNEWYFPQSSIDRENVLRPVAPTPTMVDTSSGASTRANDDAGFPLDTSVSHYEILNVCPTATTAAIKDSYHALIKQYHPDKRNLRDSAADTSLNYNNSEATNTSRRDFIQIQTAWECLRDPKARLCYDNQLQSLLRQRKIRCHQRQQNSIPISIHECRQERQLIEDDEICGEMEVVVDYIYQCRCGHDVYVAQSHDAETEDQPSFLMPFSSAKTLDGDESVDFDDMFLHCIGCSVIYDIRPVFQNESSHAMKECASRS